MELRVASTATWLPLDLDSGTSNTHKDNVQNVYEVNWFVAYVPALQAADFGSGAAPL